LPEAWDKLNWIRTSENYERIHFNKKKKSKCGFLASREGEGEGRKLRQRLVWWIRL
jgi:hypothetical protein